MVFPSTTVPGVSWDEERKSWRVRVTVKGETQYVGRYSDVDEARRARNRVARANRLKRFDEIGVSANCSGIFWDNDHGKFRVCVWKDGKRHYGTRHASYRDAVKERNQLAKKMKLTIVR